MKTFKNTIAILAILFITSCSKDDAPATALNSTPIIDTKLTLPAVLSNDNVLLIPDAIKIAGTTTDCGISCTPGSVSSEIIIDKDGVIANPSKICIEIDLVHNYAVEIVAELIAPSGESCGLLKRIYANTDSGCAPSVSVKYQAGNKLSFNSLNTTPVPTGIVPTGNYAPTAANNGNFPALVPMISLNTFLNNKNIKGTWKLKVYDCSKDDTGKLNSWKLKFDVGALQ